MGFLANQAGEAPRQAGGEERVREKEEPTVLTLTVLRTRSHNPDTGFFIAEGRLLDPVPPLPPDLVEMGVRAPPNVFIKGVSQAFEGTDQVGATMECVGEWSMDERYGLQFLVTFVKSTTPTTVEALEKYLGSGQLKGIGPASARMIVDRWGLDTLRILDNTPERLSEISGLTPNKVEVISGAWKEKRELYEVVSFLGLHGIGENLAIRVRDALGIKGLEQKVRDNPYLLTEIEGIGFKKADDVAISLGFPPNSPQRTAAALQHILSEHTKQNGHTAIPVSKWIDEAVAQLRRPREEVRRICQALVNARRVVLRELLAMDSHGNPVKEMCVSPTRDALAERSVANNLKRLIEGARPLDIEQRSIVSRIISSPDRSLDPSQKAAAWEVFQAPVSVLTGGPGTGKTTTLRSIVDAAKEMNLNVVLAAPTGRAAKRMEEAIGMEAKTMHRQLGFSPGSGFKCNENNPMSGDVFVVDEASMVDTMMMSAWLRAIPSGARAIMVGDADQLPSVGAGDVLRDLIASGRVPVSRLTRVHRQAEGSGIAWSASQVKDGRVLSIEGDPWRDDFSFVRGADSNEIRTQMVDLINGLLSQGVPATDIQVLSPQRTQDCGTIALNEMLRGLLNPNRPDAEKLAEGLCVGERLMQVKNDYDLEVFNGDMGTVSRLKEDGSLEMVMEDGRTVEFPKTALKNLEFGYAITVHKSQGGERPVVIIPISRGHSFSLNRSLLYTAITRGKDRVILIGDGRTAALAVRKKIDLHRITGLLREMEVVGVPSLSSRGAAPHP